MKRFLSLLLTVAMVFSCMSITALAEDGEAAAVTFELYGSTNVATQAYAHAGSKVMLTAVEGATYKKNGVAYPAVDGPIAGTKLFEVSAGSNIFTAVAADGTEYNVPFYGVSALSKGTVANLPTTNLGTEVTEGAFIVGAHTVAYAVRADKFYQDEAYTAETAPTDVVVSGKNQVDGAKEGDTNNVYSYGFYIAGPLEAPFNVMDIMGGYYTSSGTLHTYTGTYTNSGRALITINPGNEVVVTGCDDEPIYTGYVVSSDAWHDVAVTANLPDREKANVYIDGVLVAKTPYIAADATLDKWRGPVLFAPSGPSNAYVGGSTNLLNFGGGDRTMFEIYNGGVTFPAAPAIAPAMDGETPVENTVAVTYEPALDIADYEIKVFANGAEVETMATEEGYYILVDEAIPDAQVQVKVIAPNGNVAFDHKGNELVSNVIEMNIEVPENDNRVFESAYEYALRDGETYTYAGSYIVAKAVLGATYYNNGVEIEDYIFDMEAGTVSLPVNACYNNFTAVRNGQKFGHISVYGVSFAANDDVGASMLYAFNNSRNTATFEIGGKTGVFAVPESSSSNHAFTSGMSGKKIIGHGYSFYVESFPMATDFVVMDLRETETRSDVKGKLNFQLIVDTNGNLKFVDYTGATEETGIVIEAGKWYALNTGMSITDGGMMNIYIDKALVAKANIYDPKSSIPDTLYTYHPIGGNGKAYFGKLSGVSDILTSGYTGTRGVYTETKKGDVSGTTSTARRTLMYVQRNGDFSNRPTEALAATVSGATVTATGVTSFADRAVYFDGTLVYTNGATVANDKGITVTAEGDSFTFASSKLSYTDAPVEIYAVDSMGCKVNGMFGPLKTTAEVDVESSYVEPTLPAPSQVGGALNTITVPAPDFTGVTDPIFDGCASALFINGEKAQGTQTLQGFVVESAITGTAKAYTVLVDARGNIINDLNGNPIKSEEVEVSLVSSADLANLDFSLKYEYTKGNNSTYVHAGSYVVAKAVRDAIYKNNGSDITSDVEFDWDNAIVKLPVVAGYNNFTAEKDGNILGQISVYGLTYSNDTKRIGANIANATGTNASFNLTEVSGGVAGRTAYKIGAQTTYYSGFSSGTTTNTSTVVRKYVGVGYAFYMADRSESDFVIANFTDNKTIASASNIKFKLYVNSTGDLKFVDYYGNDRDTGFDVVPGQWYEFNAGIDTEVNNKNAMLNIYINRQFVASASMFDSASGMSDAMYIHPPKGDGTNTYVGPLASVDEVLTSDTWAGTGVAISSKTDDTTLFYAQRNGNFSNRPAAFTANVTAENEITTTDFDIPTGRKVLVNGEDPSALGIEYTVTNGVLTFSSLLPHNGVSVEIFATDTTGNKINGMYGPIVATIDTFDIKSSLKFDHYSSTDKAASTNANAGTKIILVTKGLETGARFYNNGKEIFPEDCPSVADAKLFVVNKGSNIFTVEKDGITLGPINVYGYVVQQQAANEYGVDLTDISMGGTKVDATTAGLPVGLIDDDLHTFAYRIDADRISDDNLTADDVAFIEFNNGSSASARYHVSGAYGFYIDGELTENFNVLDLRTGKSDNTAFGKARGKLNVTIDTTNTVLVEGSTGGEINTGYKVTSDVWHNISFSADYSKASAYVNLYIDDILIAKVVFNTSTRTSSYGPVLVNLSGGGNVYVGNATQTKVFEHFPAYISATETSYMVINREYYPDFPSISVAPVDGVDNAIAVTYDNPVELASTGCEVKVFVNGVEVATKESGNNLIIKSTEGFEEVPVYVAVVDPYGNIVTGPYGNLLETAPIPMRIVVNDVTIATLEDNTVRINRAALGEAESAELAVVSVFDEGKPEIEILADGKSEATIKDTAKAVFVWIWETLKPLVDNLK